MSSRHRSIPVISPVITSTSAPRAFHRITATCHRKITSTPLPHMILTHPTHRSQRPRMLPLRICLSQCQTLALSPSCANQEVLHPLSTSHLRITCPGLCATLSHSKPHRKANLLPVQTYHPGQNPWSPSYRTRSLIAVCLRSSHRPMYLPWRHHPRDSTHYLPQEIRSINWHRSSAYMAPRRLHRRLAPLPMVIRLHRERAPQVRPRNLAGQFFLVYGPLLISEAPPSRMSWLGKWG